MFQVNLAQTYKTSLPSRTGHKYVGLRPLGVAAGLVERAKRRGAHRRKRERKPCEGMMLHQDGSQHRWLTGQAPLDLIVTMDDATSTIYSAFLVEEEGTASTFCGLLEVFVAHGLPCSLYTDRGSHYFYTDKAGEAVDKDRLTQVGRALDRLGVEHIPAYSPEARGRSERMFATLQDRLVKELEHAGLRDIATANRWIREVYLARHNARFARPAAVAEKAFVAVDPALLRETLWFAKKIPIEERLRTDEKIVVRHARSCSSIAVNDFAQSLIVRVGVPSPLLMKQSSFYALLIRLSEAALAGETSRSRQKNNGLLRVGVLPSHLERHFPQCALCWRTQAAPF